jgi:hypothetical protein
MFESMLEYKPEVIFIDSFYCLTNKGLSKEEGFLPVRQFVKLMKDKTGATIIILHHAAKPQYEKGEKVEKEDPFLGSQYLKAFADLMIHIKKNGENKVLMEVTKASRNNEGVKQISLQFNKLTWVVSAIESETTKSAIGAICDFLAKSFIQGITVTSDMIAKETGLTKRHIRRLKNDRHFSHLVTFDESQGSGKDILWKPKNQKSVESTAPDFMGEDINHGHPLSI